MSIYNYKTWDARQWREWYEATAVEDYARLGRAHELIDKLLALVKLERGALHGQDLIAAVVQRLKEWEITACDDCAADIVGLVQAGASTPEPRSHLRMLAHTTGTCPVCSREMAHEYRSRA